MSNRSSTPYVPPFRQSYIRSITGHTASGARSRSGAVYPIFPETSSATSRTQLPIWLRRSSVIRLAGPITLLAYGWPLQAIVVAFGLDERTVRDWWRRAGEHCQNGHEHALGQSTLDLEQVQADEIKVKMQRGTLWLAMAMMVSTRLWLGGVVSQPRDLRLIRALVAQVRAVALCRPLPVAVDGLVSYVTAFQHAFRSPVPRCGQVGHCKLRAWSELALVQVVNP